MDDWAGKRYWIIGASEGLGRALAQKMSKSGVKLVLSARSEDRLKELAAELPAHADVVTIDVTDLKSVEKAAKEAGAIDGMVYLAGAYWPMPATEWDNEKAELMGDTNFLGAMRCVGAVLPTMVQKNEGHIILTSSLTAYRGLPGSIGYGASKAALLSLAEGMRADLKETNVNVQIVNPGFIKTRLTDKNDFNMPMMMEPEDAAAEIFEHMNSDDFKKSFPAPMGIMLRASQFLPDWLYYKLV